MRELLLFAQPDQLNEATSHYIDTVGQAARQHGLVLRHVRRLRDIPWRAKVLVVESKSAFKLRCLRPHCSFWIWMQGVFPEEARLHFNSKAREALWNLFERVTLPRAKGILMVSQAMREHFRRKYPSLTTPVFVMPCANASLDTKSFEHPGKYSNPSFVYAGSMHAWQCFDLTLQVYQRIKMRVPSASLTIFTGSVDAARAALDKAGLGGVSVSHVPLQQLQGRLAEFKYGFVLRQQHVVNQVATPTKVSSYMAAGVIPIMTTAVGDYNDRLSSAHPIVISASTEADAIADAVLALEAAPLRADSVLGNYQAVFNGYFEHRGYLAALTDYLDQTGMSRH